MKRYQVYLNQGSVQVLDEFKQFAGINRSDVIRQAVDRLAINLGKVLSLSSVTKSRPSKSALDDLVGFMESSDLVTDYSEKDDFELTQKI